MPNPSTTPTIDGFVSDIQASASGIHTTVRVTSPSCGGSITVPYALPIGARVTITIEEFKK
jgi:hypothetical protein